MGEKPARKWPAGVEPDIGPGVAGFREPALTLTMLFTRVNRFLSR